MWINAKCDCPGSLSRHWRLHDHRAVNMPRSRLLHGRMCRIFVVSSNRRMSSEDNDGVLVVPIALSSYAIKLK